MSNLYEKLKDRNQLEKYLENSSEVSPKKIRASDLGYRHRE